LATVTEAASPAAQFFEQLKQTLIDGHRVDACHGCTLEVGASAPSAADAIPLGHGRYCSAESRLYIEQEVCDEVLAGVADRARHIEVGRGLESDTEMGPPVSAELLERGTGYALLRPVVTRSWSRNGRHDPDSALRSKHLNGPTSRREI